MTYKWCMCTNLCVVQHTQTRKHYTYKLLKVILPVLNMWELTKLINKPLMTLIKTLPELLQILKLKKNRIRFHIYLWLIQLWNQSGKFMTATSLTWKSRNVKFWDYESRKQRSKISGLHALSHCPHWSSLLYISQWFHR